MTLPINPAEVNKVLVIKLRAVGDVLLSTIVMENLRRGFPRSDIHFLTQKPAARLLEGSPFIDRLLVYDPSRMSGLALIRMVRQQQYDLVIDLFGNPRTALLTRLSGARHRVGYKFRGRTYAYTIVVEPRGGHVHNTQFNLDALEAIGVPIVDRSLHVSVSEEDDAVARAFLETLPGSPLIGVNAGGGWYTKRWGTNRFAELSDRLIEEYGGTVLLLWGPGELAEVEHLRSQMTKSPVIPPATTLPQLAALFKRCAFVVSNDSGPMHLAAAVGTPVLGIYGPTNPALQGPYGPQHEVVRREGLPCLGCNLTSCPIGHPCMLELTVEDVMGAVARLVAKNGITVSRPRAIPRG